LNSACACACACMCNMCIGRFIHVCVCVCVRVCVCVCFPNFQPQSDIRPGHVSQNVGMNQSDTEELNRCSMTMSFFLNHKNKWNFSKQNM